jgi:WD40 repeat protein
VRHLIPPLTLLLALPLPVLAQEEGKDALGDPLPQGAVARLGTERMKNFDSYGARLHPDGKHLIAFVRGKLTLLDPTSGEAVGLFGKGDRGIAALSGDGKRAVTASYDGFVVWDVESGKTVYEEKGRPVGYDDSVQLTPDGKYLAVGGRVNEKMKDKGVTVTVYDLEAKQERANLKVAQNTSARIALSGDGKRAVTWGYHNEPAKPGQEPNEEANPNKLLQFWDVGKEEAVGTARLPAGYSVASVALAPTGEVAAASTGDGSIHLFDPATGKKKKELLARYQMGGTLTFSQDGLTLAATASDGTVQLWDLESGKSLGLASPPARQEYLSVTSLVFTGPATALALGRVGETEVVWEVPSGKVISPTGGHRQSVTGVTFSPDGKEVLSTGNSGETIRWDTTGKKLGDVRLTLPGGPPRLPPSTRVLIPAAGNLAVRGDSLDGMGVYDLPDGKQRFALPSPYSQEAPFGVSADGKTMVMALAGGYPGPNGKPKPYKLAVIDVPNSSKTNEFVLPAGTVTAVAVTPDGTKAGLFRTVPADKGETRTIFCGIDLATGKVLGESEEKGWSISHLAATPDGKGMLTNKQGATGLVVTDLATGEKTREFKEFKTYVSAGPVFSPDGKRFAVVGDPSGTPKVSVIDWESGAVTHAFSGHIRAVTCLAFSPDGKTLATGSYDTTVLLWDVSKE